MTVVGRDFLFIHVTKCAGKAVARKLGGTTRGVPGHAPRFWFEGRPESSKFSFGFVLNPWDRMVSSYAFICSKPRRRGDDDDQKRSAQEAGFRRWLLEGAFFLDHDRLWNPDGTLPPYQRRSQMFWLDGCDAIGRVETLEADLTEIQKRITIRRSLRDLLNRRSGIAVRNRSPRGDYRDYYDDETIAFVAHHAAAEIARFGYSF